MDFSEMAKELGKRGGDKVLRERGIKHFRELGKRGGDKVLRERGKEYFSEIGRLSASKRKEKMTKLT